MQSMKMLVHIVRDIRTLSALARRVFNTRARGHWESCFRLRRLLCLRVHTDDIPPMARRIGKTRNWNTTNEHNPQFAPRGVGV